MISLIMAAMLAMQTTSICKYNDSQLVNCQVLIQEEGNHAGIGIQFETGDIVVFGGVKVSGNPNALEVNVVRINGEDFNAEGVCLAEDGIIGCIADVSGTRLKIVAANNEQ